MSVTISGSGQVPVQIQSVVKTDVFSTSSASWIDVDGLSVTITPSSASNKIMIFADVKMSGTDFRGSCQFRLVRNGTAINVATGTSARLAATGGWEDLPSSGIYMIYSQNAMFLDSPATTSAVTYKVQVIVSEAYGSVVVNRTGPDTDNSFYPRSTSNISVMEIAYA